MNIQYAIEKSQDNELPLGPTSFYYENLVPKGLQANLEYRAKVIDEASRSEKVRQDLYSMCSRDILFYINTFAWTLNPKEHHAAPLRPFITYPFQDRAIGELQGSIGKNDIAIPKTRDMGASWMCLLTLAWFWHFRDRQLFGLTSEKKELVDGKSEKALFKKLDFFLHHLPKWLAPNIVQGVHRTAMHLENPDTGSSFDGEATVEDMGTGDRRTAILLDEASKMANAREISIATRDVSNCRIYNSTPKGQSGKGGEFYLRCQNPATTKVFIHWSEHPFKSRGLYKKVDGEKILLPEDYRWQDDYDFKQLTFHGDNRPRSVWYDKECDRSNSVAEVEQELDIGFLGSSEKFLDMAMLIAHRNKNCVDPYFSGHLSVDPDDFEAGWSDAPDGPFKLWVEFDGDQPIASSYTAGVDIGAGTGGEYSSHSAIVVFENATGKQVARFATRDMKPPMFARYCIGVCKWFHDAFMVPESNGSTGAEFVREVAACGYYRMYRRTQSLLGSEKTTKKYGYQNQDKGGSLFTRLQDAMMLGKCTILDELIIDELLEYDIKDGKPHHTKAATNQSEADKGFTHGDMAIAAACGWEGIRFRSRGKTDTTEQNAPNETPSWDCPYNRFKARMASARMANEEVW